MKKGVLNWKTEVFFAGEEKYNENIIVFEFAKSRLWQTCYTCNTQPFPDEFDVIMSIYLVVST